MRRMIYLSLGVLGAALLPFGLSNTSARAHSAANLRGTCVWQEAKFPTTSGDQAGVGPATILATIKFDGSGAMTMDYDANIDGTYSSTNGVLGSYSIDSTGHGTFSFASPASGYVRTYDFRISPDGNTIYTMAQSDGVGNVSQRVSFGSCSFRDDDESRSGEHDSGPFSRH
ncbi:MAG: hypothetical protein ACRD4Y_01120 [Candidatus Acidiferrales bacterium]